MQEFLDEKKFVKKRHNLYSIMGIIGDIIFYPIIIVVLACCVIISFDKSENKVPSIFGISIANIISDSMSKGGFYKNDIIFLQKATANDLRSGDIIAFYFYKDSTDSNVQTYNSILVQEYDREQKVSTFYNLPEPTEEKQNKRASMEEVSAKKASLYFHRIINIYATNDGTLFYQTQGDTNDGYDSYLICEDYVVGEYVNTPVLIRGLFKFIASPVGTFIVFVMPLSILVLLIMFSIIEQISRILIEKKVLKRQIRYDSPESLNANIGIEMDFFNKIKFFVYSPEEEIADVAQFLWGYLKYGKRKDVVKYNQIMEFIGKFHDDPKQFWLFWINEGKSKKMKDKIKYEWEIWKAKNYKKNL
ncbi:MAG: hypothetical protein PHX09_01750 [Clostridia bacterium]|nr:hypothetical protein [Clostridia bacterium]MDD4685971.1 hypothetical protein [Clostridia bacterium]